MRARVLMAVLLVGAGALLAYALWPQETPSGPLGPAGPEGTSGARAPQLRGAPPEPEPAPSAAGEPAPGGPAACEIRVSTFGEPQRNVLVQVVPPTAPPAASVRVRATPGEQIRLQLTGAAIRWTRVDMPDPVPPRLSVRVPARDDPRLAEPVLRVVDAASGRALQEAILDPATAAPEFAPVAADDAGRIRVPPALADRLLHSHAAGLIAERDHAPVRWSSLPRMGDVPADAWDAWDASGEMRVALESFPTDPPVPRRVLQVVGEDGQPRPGCLVLLRTLGAALLCEPTIPSRGGASGRVEVIAPNVAAYDVYDGGALVGTFVLARAATPEDTPRPIRVPSVVRVHVVVEGLPGPEPGAVLHGPEVTTLERDEQTGWARIDGQIAPGWKAFSPATGARVPVVDAQPAEMDLRLPRGVPVALDVAGRRAMLRVEQSTTVLLDWGDLPPIPREAGNVAWSLTREGLDDAPGSPPAGPR